MVLCLALVTCLSIEAHSRTEIGFRFSEKDENTFLDIHLTSLTLFDLIYDLYPELESKESLNLSHFEKDYEQYFNRKLSLTLNEKKCSLKLVDTNLITHDATITFQVENLTDEIESYRFVIEGFDFYQSPRYTVLFATETMTGAHFLSRSQQGATRIPLAHLPTGDGILRCLPLYQSALQPPRGAGRRLGEGQNPQSGYQTDLQNLL